RPPARRRHQPRESHGGVVRRARTPLRGAPARARPRGAPGGQAGWVARPLPARAVGGEADQLQEPAHGERAREGGHDRKAGDQRAVAPPGQVPQPGPEVVAAYARGRADARDTDPRVEHPLRDPAEEHRRARHLHDAPSILDCGPTVLQSLKRSGRDPGAVDFVLLSHLHGDHFGGVPFLFMEYRYEEPRSRPLAVYGPPGTERRVRGLFAALYERIASEPLP